MIIESGDKYILVDPMLGKKGSGVPFTLFRFKAKRNPLVDLPDNCDDLLNKVTHCIITHTHTDHLDKAAEFYLRSKKIPIICNLKVEQHLKKLGLNILKTLEYWKPENFLNGTITGIPAIHGNGFIKKLMGNVMGFYIELPDEMSVYISGDTVYTKHVEKVLTDLKPDITVVACGTAQLDIGKPILMKMDEIVPLCSLDPAPYKPVTGSDVEMFVHTTEKVHFRETWFLRMRLVIERT